MDEETLKRVAKAAHLAFSVEELERFRAELSEILDLFKELDDAPGEDGYGVIPIDVTDILREDVPDISVDPYELLKDMKTYENYVRGPRLL
jgi:aspartyl-tRNA(Asn)/glutamyl-tRNA(Gln) amidotransferase subunit C